MPCLRNIHSVAYFSTTAEKGKSIPGTGGNQGGGNFFSAGGYNLHYNDIDLHYSHVPPKSGYITDKYSKMTPAGYLFR
jgi:hypothetical protein